MLCEWNQLFWQTCPLFFRISFTVRSPQALRRARWALQEGLISGLFYTQSPSASHRLEQRYGQEKGNSRSRHGFWTVPSSFFPREWEQREAATCSSDKVHFGVCVYVCVCVCVCGGVRVCERDREIFHTKARVPPSHPPGGWCSPCPSPPGLRRWSRGGLAPLVSPG